LRNIFDVKDDAYETLVFAYSRKLDVLGHSITKSDVEEENFPPYLEDAVMDLEKEMTNLEDTTPTATPQFAIGSK
jgi:hypothetical protein